MNALVAQSLLSAAGHGVRVAGTGEAALVALGEHRFDLVLTDLNLPDMDGLELARTIRRHADRHTAELPLVALSAHGPGVDPAALTEAGIDAFLGKPFHFARLEEILSRLVGSSSPTPLGKAAPARRALQSVDLCVLRGHAEALGRTSAARIVQTFRQSVLETARALELAMDEADMRSVTSLAHRLKGGGAASGLQGSLRQGRAGRDRGRGGRLRGRSGARAGLRLPRRSGAGRSRLGRSQCRSGRELRRSLPASGLEDVADAVNGHDQPRVGRVRLDLAADAAH